MRRIEIKDFNRFLADLATRTYQSESDGIDHHEQLFLFKPPINDQNIAQMMQALEKNILEIAGEGWVLHISLLASNTCLLLNSMNITDVGAKAFALALQHRGALPAGMSINFSNNSITDVGALAIAAALTSGNCPQPYTPARITNEIECILQKGFPYVNQLYAIQRYIEKEGTQNLCINLHHNRIGPRGIQALQEALRSPNCPEGIEIEMGDQEPTQAQSAPLPSQPKSAPNIPDFVLVGKVDVRTSNRDGAPEPTRLPQPQFFPNPPAPNQPSVVDGTEERLTSTKQFYQNVKNRRYYSTNNPEMRRVVVEPLEETPLQIANNFKDAMDETRFDHSKRRQEPAFEKELHLLLNNKKIMAPGCIATISKAMFMHNRNQKYVLHLERNDLRDAGVKEIFDNYFSSTAEIFLAYNAIGDEGAKKIAETFSRHNATQPPFTIHLNSNSIGEDGFQAFVQAFQRGSMPKYFTLDFGANFELSADIVSGFTKEVSFFIGKSFL